MESDCCKVRKEQNWPQFTENYRLFEKVKRTVITIRLPECRREKTIPPLMGLRD